MRILIVEDDERTESLAEALTDQHYIVDIATDSQAGWKFVETVAYELICWMMLSKLD